MSRPDQRGSPCVTAWRAKAVTSRWPSVDHAEHQQAHFIFPTAN